MLKSDDSTKAPQSSPASKNTQLAVALAAAMIFGAADQTRAQMYQAASQPEAKKNMPSDEEKETVPSEAFIAQVAKVQRVIRQLGSEKFRKRVDASKALVGTKDLVTIYCLMHATQHPDLEIARRAQLALNKSPDHVDVLCEQFPLYSEYDPKQPPVVWMNAPRFLGQVGWGNWFYQMSYIHAFVEKARAAGAQMGTRENEYDDYGKAADIFERGVRKHHVSYLAGHRRIHEDTDDVLKQPFDTLRAQEAAVVFALQQKFCGLMEEHFNPQRKQYVLDMLLDAHHYRKRSTLPLRVPSWITLEALEEMYQQALPPRNEPIPERVPRRGRPLPPQHPVNMRMQEHTAAVRIMLQRLKEAS